LLLEEYENPQKIPLMVLWCFLAPNHTSFWRFGGTRRNSCANGGTIADQFTNVFKLDASENISFLGISAGSALFWTH
jgi:hypothetical protein